MWRLHYSDHSIAWVIAGGFTALTVPIALYEARGAPPSPPPPPPAPACARPRT